MCCEEKILNRNLSDTLTYGSAGASPARSAPFELRQGRKAAAVKGCSDAMR